MKKFGIVRDEMFLKHNPGIGHPERPERLEEIYNLLDSPEIGKNVVDLDFKASDEDAILLIHSREYLGKIKETKGKPYYSLDPDTIANEYTYEAATLAVGGVVSAVKYVVGKGEYPVFALIRPPGHHAERDRAMGFCIFNNVSIAAAYAIKLLGVERVMIFDWDLHHGNGTQHAFYDWDSVLYISIHQYPYYPGTGSIEEVGRDKGSGYTVNIPYPAGAGDNEYLYAFNEIVIPLAVEFRPQLILVSAGFDPYYGDPLGGMYLTPEGFLGLSSGIRKIVEMNGSFMPVFVLEGGYSLRGLRDSIKNIIINWFDYNYSMDEFKVSNVYREIVDKVKNIHSRYWKL